MPLVVAWLLLSLPLAAGTGGWAAYGANEPDTSYDLASGRMWRDADATPGGPLRIYFDAFSTPVMTTASPNAAGLGTRVFAEPASQFHALLGVWKDCNQDGYVGDGRTGLLEYRSELLATSPAGGPCPAHQGGEVVFNDGQWVNEFFAIGAADPCSFREAAFRSAHCGGIAAFTKDPTAVNSNDTTVWLDFGPPGAGATPGCALAPPPRGASASGGGLLAYVTCFDDERELVVFDQVDRIVDPSNAAGLYLADPHHPQDSDSKLATHFPVNLFGDPTTGKPGLLERGSGSPTFTLFDCARGTGYTPVSGLQVDPTNNRTLDPTVHDPTGSLWDAGETAYDAIAGDCDPATDDLLGTRVYGGVLAHAQAPDAPASGLRSQDDDVLTFAGSARGIHADLSTGLPTDDAVAPATSAANGTTDQLVGARAPRDAGLPFLRGQFQGAMWSSRAIWQRTQTTQPVLVSAYARVNHSDAQLHGWALPLTISGYFGSEACGTSSNPGALPQNGWVCDPTKWYRALDGSDTMPYTAGGRDFGKPLAARAGDLYDLLDVDCYDGHLATVAGVDVQASAARLTGAPPCAPLS